MVEVRVGPAAVTIHGDTEFAVSDVKGEMSSTHPPTSTSRPEFYASRLVERFGFTSRS